MSNKVTRIPNLFGIDGYALPEEFRKYKEPQPAEEEEGFGEVLDFEVEKLKIRRKKEGRK